MVDALLLERCVNVIDGHIEKYERHLDRCENDCIDRMLNSAIIEELNELKEELGLCLK